jgi:hypothetical protein
MKKTASASCRGSGQQQGQYNNSNRHGSSHSGHGGALRQTLAPRISLIMVSLPVEAHEKIMTKVGVNLFREFVQRGRGTP